MKTKLSKAISNFFIISIPILFLVSCSDSKDENFQPSPSTLNRENQNQDPQNPANDPSNDSNHSNDKSHSDFQGIKPVNDEVTKTTTTPPAQSVANETTQVPNPKRLIKPSSWSAQDRANNLNLILAYERIMESVPASNDKKLITKKANEVKSNFQKIQIHHPLIRKVGGQKQTCLNFVNLLEGTIKDIESSVQALMVDQESTAKMNHTVRLTVSNDLLNALVAALKEKREVGPVSFLITENDYACNYVDRTMWVDQVLKAQAALQEWHLLKFGRMGLKESSQIMKNMRANAEYKETMDELIGWGLIIGTIPVSILLWNVVLVKGVVWLAAVGLSGTGTYFGTALTVGIVDAMIMSYAPEMIHPGQEKPLQIFKTQDQWFEALKEGQRILESELDSPRMYLEYMYKVQSESLNRHHTILTTYRNTLIEIETKFGSLAEAKKFLQTGKYVKPKSIKPKVRAEIDPRIAEIEAALKINTHYHRTETEKVKSMIQSLYGYNIECSQGFLGSVTEQQCFTALKSFFSAGEKGLVVKNTEKFGIQKIVVYSGEKVSSYLDPKTGGFVIQVPHAISEGGWNNALKNQLSSNARTASIKIENRINSSFLDLSRKFGVPITYASNLKKEEVEKGVALLNAVLDFEENLQGTAKNMNRPSILSKKHYEEIRLAKMSKDSFDDKNRIVVRISVDAKIENAYDILLRQGNLKGHNFTAAEQSRLHDKNSLKTYSKNLAWVTDFKEKRKLVDQLIPEISETIGVKVSCNLDKSATRNTGLFGRTKGVGISMDQCYEGLKKLQVALTKRKLSDFYFTSIVIDNGSTSSSIELNEESNELTMYVNHSARPDGMAYMLFMQTKEGEELKKELESTQHMGIGFM